MRGFFNNFINVNLRLIAEKTLVEGVFEDIIWAFNAGFLLLINHRLFDCFFNKLRNLEKIILILIDLFEQLINPVSWNTIFFSKFCFEFFFRDSAVPIFVKDFESAFDHFIDFLSLFLINLVVLGAFIHF